MSADAAGDKASGGDAQDAASDQGAVDAPDESAADLADDGKADKGGLDGAANAVPCGKGVLCTTSSHECCIDLPVPCDGGGDASDDAGDGGGCGGAATAMCVPIGSCSGGAVVRCDGPEDCASSELCCAEGAVAGMEASVMCVAKASCMGTAACHSDGDCPKGRPNCCGVLGRGGLKVCRAATCT